ncbi:MAG: tetratricopeptide repeat protein [Verrucomicrobia bacterium]|nr:tetratricopeptide repeat protein [Prolixibacteraceae bacterium]
MIKNATKEAMLNVEVENGKITIKAYTLASYPAGKVIVKAGTESLLEDTFDFHPATSYEKVVVSRLGFEPIYLEVSIQSADGKVLVDWKPEPRKDREIPESAKAAKLPLEIDSNDQLYLTGLHLEQYRHATYNPVDYYFEAIRRDPKDSRCNNALGLWYLRRGQFCKAEDYFRKAIETITERNPNPIDGEPIYNLGLTLRFQGRDSEAYDMFYKSVWNAAWMDNGYFQLACLEAKWSKWSEALEVIDRSLIRNWHNHKARQLKVSILRKSGKNKAALSLIEESLAFDAFNFSLYFEKHLLMNDPQQLSVMKSLMQGNVHNYIEFALDYAAAGLFTEAIEFINIGIEEQGYKEVYPMAFYYKAWMEAQNGQMKLALVTLSKAQAAAPDYCFPHQTEAVVALQWAMQYNPNDAKAPYYLGNFWYNAKNYEQAIECWEKSITLDDYFPTAHRNLALAYFNKRKDAQKALNELQIAFSLDTTDSRVLMELDQLYKRLNYEPAKRLYFLEEHLTLVNERDDLYLERVTLLNSLGKYDKAYDLLMARKFHPWEGGEGKVTGQYVLSLTEMAKKAIHEKAFKRAVDLLTKARYYPENLGEGKLFGAQEYTILYWLGCALSEMGMKEKAIQHWQEASDKLQEPAPAIFYNDQQPETIYYQGLALIKLGEMERAKLCFEKLIHFGESHLNDSFKLDYFAVSLPDLQIWDVDLTQRNYKSCLNLIGMGRLGLSQLNN